MVLETDRLILRQMKQSDFEDLCKILQDDDVMYAYEGAFNNEEVQDWLNKQLLRYDNGEVGLCAVVLKETGIMIGQCGLTIQKWKDQEVLEIGYLFNKLYWHQGYASEAAFACKEYAFNILNSKSVYSIIRDTNIASQNVALRCGMSIVDKWTKHYKNLDMPHYLYSIKNYPGEQRFPRTKQ